MEMPRESNTGASPHRRLGVHCPGAWRPGRREHERLPCEGKGVRARAPTRICYRARFGSAGLSCFTRARNFTCNRRQAQLPDTHRPCAAPSGSTTSATRSRPLTARRANSADRRISAVVFPDQAAVFSSEVSKGKGAKKGDLDMTAAQRAHILAAKEAADSKRFDPESGRPSTFDDMDHWYGRQRRARGVVLFFRKGRQGSPS